VSSTSQRPDDPVLITEAEPSRADQFNARRRKYALMMGTRTICLILAAVFYRTSAWLVFAFAVAAVALPWMAVLIANDRPPKKADKVNRYSGHPTPDRALESPPDSSRVIEG
jgi:uncharacterized membrane protein